MSGAVRPVRYLGGVAIFRRNKDAPKQGEGAAPGQGKPGQAWTPPAKDAATAERPAAPPPAPRPGSGGGSPTTPGLASSQPATGAAATRKPTEGEIIERLDGIRGWLGDLDNTVRVRSRIGLVLAAIAIGAAGAAIYLSLDAKNQSASNNAVGSLRKDVSELSDTLDQSSKNSTALKGSVNAARSQAGAANAAANQVQAQVKQLQTQIKQLQQVASNPQTTTVTTPAPGGTGTTTTPSGGGNSGGNSP